MRLGLGLGLVSGSPPFDHAARVRVRASGSPPFDHAARICVRVSVKKRLSPQSPNRPNQWPETALYSAAPLRRLRPAGLPASPADVFAGSCRDRRPARRRGTPRLGFGRKNDKVRKALAAVACPARAAAAPALAAETVAPLAAGHTAARVWPKKRQSPKSPSRGRLPRSRGRGTRSRGRDRRPARRRAPRG